MTRDWINQCQAVQQHQYLKRRLWIGCAKSTTEIISFLAKWISTCIARIVCSQVFHSDPLQIWPCSITCLFRFTFCPCFISSCPSSPRIPCTPRPSPARPVRLFPRPRALPPQPRRAAGGLYRGREAAGHHERGRAAARRRPASPMSCSRV